MSNLVSVPKKGSLVNSNSNQNFPTLSNWLDDIFNRDLIPSAFTSNFNTGITLPKVNIKETANDFAVEMAVPGLKKSDFQIDIDNQVLSISTETKEDNEHKEENYTRREFGYSSFKRTFTLPWVSRVLHLRLIWITTHLHFMSKGQLVKLLHLGFLSQVLETYFLLKETTP